MPRYDLAQLDWSLKGYSPHVWRSTRDLGLNTDALPEVGPVPARVPGSVQQALRDGGLIPDWNTGLRYRESQWVEHLDWIFEADIPDEWFAEGPALRLRFEGLDYQGQVYLNRAPVGAFRGAFAPHEFDLSSFAGTTGNRLAIVFQGHPRWLGQFGFTSQIRGWKPRFYYGWDWIVRVVQIGVWDAATFVTDGRGRIDALEVRTDVDLPTRSGSLRCSARLSGLVEGGSVRLTLTGPHGAAIREARVSAADLERGIEWRALAVALWWPNGHGEQPLYTLTCELLDADGVAVDCQARSVGFKHVEWRACQGAPSGADPWLCAVNDKPIFLQGVNWTPVRPNFADVRTADVRDRLELYQRLGLNVLRVWGGAVLEREDFYGLCDELGIMVWQEFPLSSSGLDNWPPEDPHVIDELCAIAESYVARRAYHVSLLMWSGGNELQGGLDGGKMGTGKPVDASHPLIARLTALMARIDPQHRTVPTSSSGPRFSASAEEFGQGLHWDVHGPWKIPGDYQRTWVDYWDRDDALFRSETGCPGASPVALLERYCGDLAPLPISAANPFWARTSWWVEDQAFAADHGHPPDSLEEYVAWSQERQRRALAYVVERTKQRFPACGGIILWMGHDCYPCPANTSIVDFDGQPKPAALAVGEIFNAPQPGDA
ncbi:MAG: hypothetical protein GX601_19355 [Anaerolineales bacterium]|nr:hypothetical protein [Anaerolineales bacterium]